MIRQAVLTLILVASVVSPAQGDDGPVMPGDDDTWLVNMESWKPGDSGADPGPTKRSAHEIEGDWIPSCLSVVAPSACQAELVCEETADSPLGGLWVMHTPTGAVILGWCDFAADQLPL
jgi:hypothetical protein